MTNDSPRNLVSGLRSAPRRPSRYRWVWLTLWLAAVIVAAATSLATRDRTTRGVGLVALIFLVTGGAVARVSGASARLSSSEREMKDHVWPGNP